MIFINPDSVKITSDRIAIMAAATLELGSKPAAERATFFDKNRSKTWGSNDIISAMRALVGNKCWYSEVLLDGSDPNIDHFRPKGRIREVGQDLEHTGSFSEGYWWLAFDHQNFRLASMHSNQRRTDLDTSGGKSDYFPVKGDRAIAGTACGAIVENVLPLDPCSASDVSLLCFDLEARPCAAQWRKRKVNDAEKERVKVTIWLYHLDKSEVQIRRAGCVQEIQTDIQKARIQYGFWAPDSTTPNLQAKLAFDQKISEIRLKIDDKAEFAGAKRCAIRAAMADNSWIEESGIL